MSCEKMTEDKNTNTVQMPRWLLNWLLGLATAGIIGSIAGLFGAGITLNTLKNQAEYRGEKIAAMETKLEKRPSLTTINNFFSIRDTRLDTIEGKANRALSSIDRLERRLERKNIVFAPVPYRPEVVSDLLREVALQYNLTRGDLFPGQCPTENRYASSAVRHSVLPFWWNGQHGA